MEYLIETEHEQRLQSSRRLHEQRLQEEQRRHQHLEEQFVLQRQRLEENSRALQAAARLSQQLDSKQQLIDHQRAQRE